MSLDLSAFVTPNQNLVQLITILPGTSIGTPLVTTGFNINFNYGFNNYPGYQQIFYFINNWGYATNYVYVNT